MKAGQLRHRITIERKTITQDNTGAMTETWSEFATVWAQVSPLSAREAMQAAALNSTQTARMIIRWRDDLDATMRIKYRGEIYEIEGLIEDMNSGREYLTIPVHKVRQ